MTLVLLYSWIPFFIKARFPIVEHHAADVGYCARFRYTPARFPRLEQQFPLLRGSRSEIYAFYAHVPILPFFEGLLMF